MTDEPEPKHEIVWGVWKDNPGNPESKYRVGIAQYKHPYLKDTYCMDTYVQTKYKEDAQ